MRFYCCLHVALCSPSAQQAADVDASVDAAIEVPSASGGLDAGTSLPSVDVVVPSSSASAELGSGESTEESIKEGVGTESAAV